MLYINSQNEYPRYYGDIKLENPDWSLGDDLPDGWHQVKETQIPEVSENEIAIQLAPELVDGEYFQVWSVRDLTEQELVERDAPASALAKLDAAGLTDYERKLIALGIVK